MTRYEPLNVDCSRSPLAQAVPGLSHGSAALPGLSQQHSDSNIAPGCKFTEAVSLVKTLVLQEFDCQIAKNQLYYHTREHINKVQHRANIIFQTIYPNSEASLAENRALNDVTRMHLLLDLCAVSHDLVQIFLPQTEPHTSRRREAGVSETLTIEKLFEYIHCVNQQIQAHCFDDSALFTEADLLIIQEAIAATICAYDADERVIYQPALYDDEKPISPVARILALADINSLAMEGVDSFNQEGNLLFLEENPDVIPILLNQEVKNLALANPELFENIRQRLLKRSRFQVNFAKSRLKRYTQEIASFPPESISILKSDIFQYLTSETIQEIESKTPTGEDTNLEALVDFFKLSEGLPSTPYPLTPNVIINFQYRK